MDGDRIAALINLARGKDRSRLRHGPIANADCASKRCVPRKGQPGATALGSFEQPSGGTANQYEIHIM